jgi:hypothetical protein
MYVVPAAAAFTSAAFFFVWAWSHQQQVIMHGCQLSFNRANKGCLQLLQLLLLLCCRNVDACSCPLLPHFLISFKSVKLPAASTAASILLCVLLPCDTAAAGHVSCQLGDVHGVYFSCTAMPPSSHIQPLHQQLLVTHVCLKQNGC